jgi:signal transduction histidine kinase
MTFTETELSPSEAILAELMHDLRQPLGNIEISAYCLDLITDPAQERAHEHLRTIQRQVARAADLLTQASAELRRLRAC